MRLRILLMIILILSSAALVEAQEFDSDTLLIRRSLTQGESFIKTMELTSTEHGEVGVKEVPDVGYIETDKVAVLFDEIQKEDSVFVTLDATGLDRGIYVSSLELESPVQKLTIPVILQVVSETQTFGATVNVPPAKVVVPQGESITADIVITNLGTDSTEVELETGIIKIDSTQVTSETETLAVEGARTSAFSFSISDDVDTGTYVLYATTYNSLDDSFTVASQLFTVIEPVVLSPIENIGSLILENYFLVVVGVLSILLIAFLFFNRFWHRKLVYMKEANELVRQMKDSEITYLKEKALSDIDKLKSQKETELKRLREQSEREVTTLSETKEAEIKRLEEQKTRKEDEVKELRQFEFDVVKEKLKKLERQKTALEEAHDKGYITEESYSMSVDKLKKLIETLKKRL